MINSFAYVFLLAILLSTGVKLWLATRQISAVRKHRNQVPVAFEEEISLEAHKKAADYTAAKMKHARITALVDTVFLIALTFGGLLNWCLSFAQDWSSSYILSGLIFFGLLTVISSVLQLPFDVYKTFVLEEKFGFNKMTPGLFLKDFFLGLIVSGVIGSIFISLILWIMETSGSYWWINAWLLSIAFWFFMQYISPSVVAPLFNKFSPLENESLKERIESLLKKCGFQSSGLFVMDGSKRSSHGNAYFTGFGKTKRIVFFDTLISRHEPNEIEAVLAHELGHFKLRHVQKLSIFLAASGFLFFWFLGVIQETSFMHEGMNIGFFDSNAMLLAMFYFVLPPFLFFVRPMLAAYLRKNEFEADEYASRHAPARDLIAALVKLYKDNSSTLTPDKVYSSFYDSHPGAMARINRLESLAAQTN